jgi:peptide/nickel transport system substrate-binding protein
MKGKFGLAGMVAATLLGALATATAPALAQGEKTIKIAMNADPDVLDMTVSTNPPQGYATLQNVYDQLDETGVHGQVVPALATSWDVEDGGKAIVFHLRHGVKFQSGDPFTAEDVVWSEERLLKKTWWYGIFARFVEKVVAVDPYTVKFIFKEPDAEFVPVHALIIGSKRYFDRVGEKEFAAHPVGTGPYKIVDYKPAQYLDLATWKGYWGKEPQIKKAHFVFIQDANTRVASLQSGEVDMIMATPYSSYHTLMQQGYTEVRLPVHPTQSIQMQFANTTTPWHNLKIRQAMAYAIDKKAIVKGLLHGVPYYYPRLMPDEIGYDPHLNRYPYNPEKARKLEAEAGYPNGFDMPLYYTTGTYFGTEETATAVALYLKQNLHITSHVHGMQLITLLQMLQKMGTDKTARYVGVAGIPVANLTTPLEGVELYYTGPRAIYQNPELDKLLGAANATFDPKKQAPIISKMMKIENEDLSTITLWDYVDVYAMKKGVSYTPGRHGLEIVYLPWVHEAANFASK